MCFLMIDNEVRTLLDIYTDFEHEVGGILFGGKKNNQVQIRALSFKHGQKYKINFTKKDFKLFSVPEKMEMIGTWHTHPFQILPKASSIDINQWKNWNSKYYHMIVGQEELKIYKIEKNFLFLKKVEEIYIEKRSKKNN